MALGIDKGKSTDRSIATKQTIKKRNKMNLSKEPNAVFFMS
jgi:hypothetical protein